MAVQRCSSALPSEIVLFERGTEPLAGERNRPAAKSFNVTPVAPLLAKDFVSALIIDSQRGRTFALGSF